MTLTALIANNRLPIAMTVQDADDMDMIVI